MKTINQKSGMWQVAPSSLRFDATRSDKVENTAHPRHSPPATRHSLAFTIVELLVVIAIIGILAGMILPALSRARIAAQKTQARKEMSDIVVAIQKYDSDYGRFPVSAEAQNKAAANAQAGKNPDFTYGGVFTNASATAVPVFTPDYEMTNCEVMAILMDLTNYPNGSGMTINTNHQKNPQQTIFLNPKMSGWDTSQGGVPSAGVDNNLVYRDPWGNPYVITMDLSYDEQCRDAFYSLQIVSQFPDYPAAYVQTGFNGLTNPNAAPGTQPQKDSYQYHGKVMVWSAGPDGKIDPTIAADQGVNKDNVISWK